ncbi:hypothetical protein HYQ46_008116 [Verticillium longisporum]|nr:hypothetical protein HYQ46_008116 [Verticillium longisporum]
MTPENPSPLRRDTDAEQGVAVGAEEGVRRVREGRGDGQRGRQQPAGGRYRSREQGAEDHVQGEERQGGFVSGRWGDSGRGWREERRGGGGLWGAKQLRRDQSDEVDQDNDEWSTRWIYDEMYNAPWTLRGRPGTKATKLGAGPLCRLQMPELGNRVQLIPPIGCGLESPIPLVRRFALSTVTWAGIQLSGQTCRT